MSDGKYEFHLYICSDNGEVKVLVAKLHEHIASFVEGEHELKVKSLFEDSYGEHAIKDGVFSVPTLVRKYPGPIDQISGDLCGVNAVQLLLEKGKWQAA